MQVMPIEMQIKPFIVLILLVSFTSLVIIYSKTNENIGNRREVIAFKGMLASFMAYALVDIRLIIGDSFYTILPRTLVLFIVGVGFAAMSFACYFWFMHVRSGSQASSTTQKKEGFSLFNVLIQIPLLVCLVFLFTPLYTNIYELTEDGPIFKPSLLMLLLMDYVYLIIATGISIRNARQAKTHIEKKKYRSQTIFIVFFTISGYLIGFLLNLPAIELCVIPVVLHIFVQLQDSQIYTDALTRIYNRRRLTDFINEELVSCSPDNPLTVVMIDLDYFKSINDILGHDAGDRALITFANALQDITRSMNATVGRWGGDEFVVVGKDKALNANFREKLTEALQKDTSLRYKPIFSIGIYNCVSSSRTCDQVIMEADSVLYRDKDDRRKEANEFVKKLKEIKGR